MTAPADDLEAWAEELTRDWPPPDKPEQLAVLRRVFGPNLTKYSQDPATGTPAKKSPAAGHRSPQKDAA